ncbi:hypothetical protein [Paludibacterium denitrificans]|uniref:hypothetical protein n=1 Tax=Paludibacterium denitrificans TaxID=2675226 RepID=UPI001E521C5E|nr:hypothetical protein [Paludibacterium denitrificans]
MVGDTRDGDAEWLTSYPELKTFYQASARRRRVTERPTRILIIGSASVHTGAIWPVLPRMWTNSIWRAMATFRRSAVPPT